jgi:hypothetical protein
MSVLFTYADQQRAAQNSQAELATIGINNPAIIADHSVCCAASNSATYWTGSNSSEVTISGRML